MEYYEPETYRKLFIGGLNSHTTTDDSLKNFFGKWGHIVDAVVIKDRQTKMSRGFGFVTYAQSFMAHEAMKNKPHFIDGREVDTKRILVPKDIEKLGIVNVRKMFISNIKEQSEHDIVEYFGKYGNIINTTIITDKNSGQRKGFGFIEYDDAHSVDKAIFIQSHQVAGGKLFVEKALSRIDGNGGGRCVHGGEGGINRSWCGENHLNKQWNLITVHHKRPNGCSGGGHANYGTGEGYGHGYNSNYGGALQGIPQMYGNNRAVKFNQEGVCYSRGGPQPANYNWGPNNSYGSSGPIKSYYTSNHHATPYENPGAGNVNTGNSGGVIPYYYVTYICYIIMYYL